MAYPFSISAVATSPQNYGFIFCCMLTVAAFARCLPIIGFRVVRLAGNVTDQELESGTQLGLDEWIERLDAVGGKQMNRVELVTFLREQGIPFDWRRVVTDAYETAIGRIVIGKSGIGLPQLVATDSDATTTHTVLERLRHQWSIRQLLVLSFLAACLFAFLRRFSVLTVDSSVLLSSVPVVLGATAIAIPVVHNGLSVKPKRSIPLAIWLIALIVARIVFVTIHPTNLVIRMCGAVTVLEYTLFLFPAVAIIRSQGYRIVATGKATRRRPSAA
ncbi:MAG: hypothetical protein R3C05_15695 [Pirellulaceae bacterium]